MSRLGAILRAHGPDYRQRFGPRIAAAHLRVMRALEACHTADLGGVCWQCPRCQERVFAYRSCGNRHCPACGQADARLWRERQERLLLPVTVYHLVTFTVPERLRRPIRSHPRQALPLLMQSAASSLLTLCRERRFLGGLPGLTAILHTWTRQLLYHPHVHILCTGGGLDPAGAWRASAPGFLVPVRALSTIFRARFRDALRQRHPALFAAVPARVWRQPWVVHSKPVGAGGHALGYLARYVHRVALADSAILHHDDRQVVFRYLEGDTGRVRTARIAPTEFIRRFLQHTLPSAFRKVRHYGLHHSSRRRTLRSLQAQLALAHRLDPPPAEPPRREPLPPRHCPLCNEPMRPCYAFDRQARPRPLPFPPARARGPPR